MPKVSAEELLEVGFMRYEGVFADGQPANNKLDLGYPNLAPHTALFRKIVLGLCEVAEQYKPEFTVGNPDGATGIAGAVALEMDLYCVHLVKRAGNIEYSMLFDEDAVNQLGSGLIVEDVLNRRSTTKKVLGLPQLAPKISAVIGIFDRGIMGENVELDKKVHALVTQPIEQLLPEDSPLWRYAK